MNLNHNCFHVNLNIIFLCFFHCFINTDAIHRRYLRDAKLTEKDPVVIIQEKCEEYSAARYRNVTIPGVLKGDDSLIVRVLDCSQEYPQKAGVFSVREKEYSHLAFLGTGKELNDAKWYGSGSLISDRFILTAASPVKEANWAALGLLNKSSITAEKLNKNVFKIKRTYLHPEFNASSAYNDIALHELEIPVTFSSALRPICLHTSDEIPPSVNRLATIAGWGQAYSDETDGDTLRKGKVDLIEKGHCAGKFAKDITGKLKKGFDNESMVCAGNLIEDDITCMAQNGGPLQVPIPFKPCMWSQVGITAYGSNICGDDTPTSYTKVAHYLGWIQNIVWPQS